ncbi:MAG: hypothetical protein ACPGWR_12920 [Ardenticatenaceae bacterium]
MTLQRILFLSLLILLSCACGARPRAAGAPLATATATATPTPTFAVSHQPGVAELWRDPPPAGELVEVDAYFSGATGFPMFGGAGGPQPLPNQVACPTMWGHTLSDHTFFTTFIVLNSAHTNTLPDDAPWLIATIGEATEPGRSVGPSFPYHARFRGRLGEPAFADCKHAERIFVVEEVVTIYEELAKEPPVYQFELPDGYDNWPRYQDATLGYSVPYPSDWTVEALSEAELLGAVALRAPQWPDYPIIVRVNVGEIDLLQYNPASLPPWLQKPEHGGGMFRQGSGFGEANADSQKLSGYSVYWEISPHKRGAAALFSAHGRTYELALEYPIGFEASQSLLTHFSAIVTGLELDVPPSSNGLCGSKMARR